jgi:hypothetical protein
MIEYKGIVYNFEVYQTGDIVWGETQTIDGGIAFHINQDSIMVIYVSTFDPLDVENTLISERLTYECFSIECGRLILSEKDLGSIKFLDSKYSIDGAQPIGN